MKIILLLKIVTQLGAAIEHPCFAQFELNGSPAETRKRSEVVEGETIVTEEHWYPGTEMILSYAYAEGGQWCNNWNARQVKTGIPRSVLWSDRS